MKKKKSKSTKLKAKVRSQREVVNSVNSPSVATNEFEVQYERKKRKRSASKTHSGNFVDNRIGEDDGEMTQEAKSLLRLQRERSLRAKKKGSLFQLGEDVPIFAGELGERRIEEEEESDEDSFRNIIDLSKRKRMERVMENEETKTRVEMLDAEFDSVKNVVFNLSDKYNDDQLVGRKNVVDDNSFEEMKMEFAAAMSEKARARDRVKTEEEVAEEERERLEKLEKERQRRMKGEEMSDEEEIEEMERSEKVVTGDSLEDDFDPGSDETSDEEEVTYEEKNQVIEEVNETESLKNIPFVLEVPNDHNSFLHLIRGLDIEECKVVIERIEKCNNLSLSSSNEEKMEKFLGILCEYFYHFSKLLCGELSDFSVDVKIGLDFLDYLTCLIFRLTQKLPSPTIEFGREFVQTLSTVIEKRKTEEKKCFSGPLRLSELLVVLLLGRVFPMSDFKHPISTPLLLLLGNCLMFGSVQVKSDMWIRLLSVSVMLSFLKTTSRFSPEIGVFLTTFISECLGIEYEESCVKWKLIGLKLDESCDTNELNSVVSIISVVEAQRSFLLNEENSSEKVLSSECWSWFCCAIKLFKVFANMMCEYSAFVETAGPVMNMLKNVSSFPQNILQCVDEVRRSLKNLMKRSVSLRHPLQMQADRLRPVGLKMYNPMWEEEFVGRKRFRNEDPESRHRRLLRACRREKKIVAREVRDESYSVTDAMDAKREEEEKRRAAKMRRIMGDLEDQEHAAKEVEFLTKLAK